MKNTNPDFQPITYAGGLYDGDTKLIRFGARDYDPTIGRWTTKDPIGFAGGDTNLYAYVGGNPMSRVDRSGLAQSDLDAAISWLKVNDPNLFSTNPTFTNANLTAPWPWEKDAYGEATSATSVLIDFGALDGITEAGTNRIARYIETVTHELMHTQDMASSVFGRLTTILPNRHDQIFDAGLCKRTTFEGNAYGCSCKK